MTPLNHSAQVTKKEIDLLIEKVTLLSSNHSTVTPTVYIYISLAEFMM